VDAVFANPQHPYTLGLLGSVPRPDLVLADVQDRLAEIPGVVPTLRQPPTECVFAPRCPRADQSCLTRMPELTETAPGQRAACVHPGPAEAEQREAVRV
jgi:peptide/nickel transport system ATP-binding protein